MTTRKRLKANITKMYWYAVLNNTITIAIPTIVLFWQDNGLSMTEIMILQSIFSVILVALEVPSGYFADVFGRKTAFVIASMTVPMGALIYTFGGGFLQFLAAETMMAIGFSLNSGANSAFVYDSLKGLKKEKEYQVKWGNIMFYLMASMAVFNVIGGFIATFNFRYTFIAATILALPGIPLTLSMYEPKRTKPIYEKGYIHGLFKAIHDYVGKVPHIRWIIIFSAIVFTCMLSSVWFYQPYFKMTGIPIEYFGIIFAAYNIISAVTSKYTHKIQKKIGFKNILLLLLFFTAAGNILLGVVVTSFSFLFVAFPQVVRAIHNVSISDYINSHSPSSVRATILSVESLISRLAYALVLPFIGWYTDTYSITQALTIIGVTTLILGIPAFFMFMKWDRKQAQTV